MHALLRCSIAAFLASGCVRQNEDLVQGEVFVRTRGGESIPLSLVEVRFADYDETNKILADIFVSHRQPWPHSYSEVFKALPTPLLTTTTDAQGHFTIRLPRDKQFAVTAHDTREAGAHTEEYYWCVRYPSISGEPPAKITLANDNLAGAGKSMLPHIE
jgi:hypothetical protein